MLQTVEDRLLVEPIEEEKISEAGWTMETRTEKPVKGIVLSVGPGRTLETGGREFMDIKVGDEIYFTKYAPDICYYEGKEYYSIKQSSVLAYSPKE